MKFHKFLLLAAALVLILCLAGCGGMETTAPEGTASPSPSAETTTIPTETATPGSVTEEDSNPGDVTDPDNSVMPGENHPDSAMGSAQDGSAAEQEGSSAGDDLRRAGDDLEDAARNTVHSVEDGIEDMGR